MRRFALLAATLLLSHSAAAIGLFQVYVVELYNEFTGHYVILSDPAEVAAVERGSAGPGWRRTGYTFSEPWGVTYPDTAPVCRFYAPGVNSHFFTANATECEFLRTHDTGWRYEGIAFDAFVQIGGACVRGSLPVYRLYNGRARFGDTNHRFTPDAAVRAKAISEGWIDEGVAFCTYNAFRSPEQRFDINLLDVRPSGCVTGGSGGSCIALVGIPPMNEKITRQLPFPSGGPNPDYPLAADAITGFADNVQLWTGNPHQAIAAHSFVQEGGLAFGTGIHLQSSDRASDPYSSIDPSYLFPLQGPGVFKPWGDAYNHDLVVSFRLLVKTLRRGDAASHAYGHPMIDFVDQRSGRRFHVTLPAYGTLPPGDFTGRDVATGNVIVGTSFGATQRFGRKLAGDFIGCGDCAPAAWFKFAIDRGEFAQVLAIARGVEPELSADPADYLVASFRFKNEAYGNAEIGVSFGSLAIETYFAR